MANISSIPPLFCSTPPPIDFGEEDDDDTTLPPALTLDEEDDEFGDFAVASQSNDDGTNVDVPSLPSTPVHLGLSSSIGTSGFNDMPPIEDDVKFVASSSSQQSPDDKLQSKVKPIEAFNLAILESNTPPPIDFDETITDSKNDPNEESTYNKDICIVSTDSDLGDTVLEKSVEFDTKDEDNVSIPSLKLDTLSVSSEKQSACSSLAEEDAKGDEIIDQKELNKTKDLSQSNNDSSPPFECKFTETPPCTVKLEDLEDDSSDDECYSPKKSKNIEDNETSEDFFAIHTVAETKETSTVEIITPAGLASQEVLNSHEEIENNELESAKEDEFDDFTEFADFQSTPMHMQPKMDEVVELNSKQLQLPKHEQAFSANFSQLNTLNENTDAKIEVKNEALLQTVSPLVDDVNVADDDDDFDDFQDFSAAPMETVQEAVKENTIAAIDRKIESETDDEFGDFEEAQFSQPILQAASVPTKVSVTMPSVDISQNTVCMSNLNDRLKTILEMMFPNVVCEASIDRNTYDEKSAAPNDQSILKFDSIDTAKALNYQWINSEVRHSLIKSLGIDSRNILYGEKWNSSMPRFAANLSFNPLEPMKPQQVSLNSTNAESSHSNSLNERTANITKTDVPAVEFDWNSSGLVNPLDGSKESTYTRETETIHQTQSGQSDATAEQQQQQTLTTFPNDVDDDVRSKHAVHTAAINTTTAASAIPNTTTAATLSPIISTVSISNDNDDCKTTGDNNTNLNENQYKAAESLTNNPNKYKSNNKETDNHNTDEVITTSTFAGPLKETHIYTPSKMDGAISKTNAVTKTTPIDFDYEIAAAGIIIDETVIKKEYHDIVYNPGFNLEFSNSSRAQQETLGGGINNRPVVINNFLEGAEFDAEFSDKNDNGNLNMEKPKTIENVNVVNNEFDDEFSDFQSVPPLPTSQPQIQPPTAVPKLTKDIVNNSSCSNSRTSTPTFGGGNEMILCPAILLPQAISMENSSKPKIVWGDTTANINPDELARIEELFPQPKTISAKVTTDAMVHNSHRSTPTRSITNNGYQTQQLSISANIAQKELNVDDDDWTEFVSVPVVDSKTQNFATIHNNNNQNNNLMHTVNNRTSNMPPIQRLQLQQQQQQHKQQQWQQTAKIETSSYKTNINETSTNHTNDEEWSDFVSNTPVPPSAQLRGTTSMLPQFNSAAWQNANFYNNPLSFYQSQHQKNIVPKQLQNHSSANNYHNQQYYAQQLQQQQQHQQQQQQLQLQQQIHIMQMQDFSTAPPYNRTLNASAPANSGNVPPATKNLQFQLGSAKVAPSISLIPDLGFVAPAAPTHTAFINSLPKPSFSTNTKK